MKRKFTDGVVAAFFDKKAGTLTFTGNGAVADTSRWIPEKIERFVRQIIFDKGITSIGDHEFDTDLLFSRNFVNLKKASFLGDINEVGDYAFSENPNLETVEFHGRCLVIGKMAFGDCSALKNVVGITEECRLRAIHIHHEYKTEIRSPFYGTPLQERFQSRVTNP